MGRDLKLNSDEIRIFLAFLLIFTLFIHWGGANAWSRYDLTSAIVEDQSFDISNHSYNTLDKKISLYDAGESYNEYFDNKSWEKENGSRVPLYKEEVFKSAFRNPDTVYTNKAPLSSFLAVPAYLVEGAVGDYLPHGEEIWIDRGIDSVPANLSTQTALRQFLIVLIVSVIPGALLMLLIYRYVNREVNEKTALQTVLIMGLATPVIYYATSFFGVITAAFFGFTSYIFLRKSEERERKYLIYLSGILSALAFSTEYYAGIIPLALISYLILERRGQLVKRFVAGIFIGAIPMFLYHWIITGNPFIPVFFSDFIGPGPIDSVCTTYYICRNPLSMFTVFSFVIDPVRVLNAAFRLLFFPTRGIFFYSPILLLVIPGVYRLYKRNRNLLVLFPGIFIFLILFQAFVINWLAGVSFGPRYAIVGLPFLILPLALGLKEVKNKGQLVKVFVFLVFLISVFNSFLGLQALPHVDVAEGEYDQRFNSFSPVQPEFYDNLVEKTSLYGPRSELMMSLTDRYKGLDITYLNPYGPEFIELGSLEGKDILFSLNLVPVIILMTILIWAFWHEFPEIKYMLIGAIFIMLFASINTADNYVSGEQYRGEEVVTLGNHSYDAVFHGQETVPYIEAKVYVPEKQRMRVGIENDTRSYQVRTYQDFYFPSLYSAKRKKMKIGTGGCEIPALELENSSDVRCLSIAIRNISTVSPNAGDVMYSGWFDKTSEGKFRWSTSRSEIYMYRSNTSNRHKLLSLDLSSLNESRVLNVTVNGNTFERVVSPEDRRYLFFFRSREGFNNVSFEVGGECTVVGSVSDSDDSRCVSFGVRNLSVLSPEGDGVFYGGWFDRSSVRDIRWSRGDSGVYVYRNSSSEDLKLLKLSLNSLNESRKLNITVNGKTFERVLTPQKKDYLIYFQPRQGFNNVSFEVGGECTVVGSVSDSDDSRCVSFGVRNLSMVDSYSTRVSNNFSAGVSGSGNYSLSLDGSVVSGESIMEVRAGNKIISSTLIGEFGSNFSTPYFEINRSNKLDVLTDCPEECGYLNVEKLELDKSLDLPENISYRLGESWYNRVGAENYRWSKGNASLYIYNSREKPFNKTLRIFGRSFHIPQNITYIWNSEELDERKVSTKNQSEKMNVTLQKGENILEMSSPTSCTSMGKVNNNNDIRCGFFGLNALYVGEDRVKALE